MKIENPVLTAGLAGISIFFAVESFEHWPQNIAIPQALLAAIFGGVSALAANESRIFPGFRKK